MRVKVRVTKEHIRKGKRLDRKSCPVALALKPLADAHHLPSPTVGDSTYSFSGCCVADCPRSVTKFVHRFDQRKPVKPFTFIAEI